MQMLKTMVYLPPKMKSKIEGLAKSQGTSQAEVIRDALEEGLESPKFRSNASVEVLFKIAEIGKKYQLKGPHDSTNIDKYLWGKDWDKDE